MTCHNCQTKCQRFGKDRKGNQRFRCCQCIKTFSSRPERLDGTNKTQKEIEQIIRLLVEGMSVRSIERITSIHRDTILSVMRLAGERCEHLMERMVRRIPVKNVETDEIWSYVGCHERRNVSGNPTFGDAYCFVGMESNTKLILCWQLGKRTATDTYEFISRLDEATTGTFQLSTDGYQPYFEAIHAILAHRVHYGQIIKSYGQTNDDDHRYSPPQVVDITLKPMWGNPDPRKICTSYIRRKISPTPNAPAKTYAINECVQQKVGESEGGRGVVSTTIFAGFIKRSGLRPRWNPG